MIIYKYTSFGYNFNIVDCGWRMWMTMTTVHVVRFARASCTWQPSMTASTSATVACVLVWRRASSALSCGDSWTPAECSRSPRRTNAADMSASAPSGVHGRRGTGRPDTSCPSMRYSTDSTTTVPLMYLWPASLLTSTMTTMRSCLSPSGGDGGRTFWYSGTLERSTSVVARARDANVGLTWAALINCRLRPNNDLWHFIPTACLHEIWKINIFFI